MRNKSEIAELFAKPAKSISRRSPLSPAAKSAVPRPERGAESQLPPEMIWPETWRAFIQHLEQTTCRFSGEVHSAGLKLAFVLKPAVSNGSNASAGHNFQVFISPTKRLGKAVLRNRAKRLQREFYRHSKAALRQIGQGAAAAACEQFAHQLAANISSGSVDFEPTSGSPKAEKVELLQAVCRAVCLKVEQRLLYHWGLVIYRQAVAAELLRYSEAKGWPGSVWQDAQIAGNTEFGLELQRYQLVLSLLGRRLQKEWLQHLQQVWNALLPADQHE